MPSHEDYLNEFASHFSFPVEAYTTIRTYKPGEQILGLHQVPTTLIYLIEGKLKLTFYESNGKDVIKLLRAPGFLGEMEFLGIRKDTTVAQAYERCVCAVIDLAECRHLLKTDAKFLLWLSSCVSREAYNNMQAYVRLSSWPLHSRIAQFILEMEINGLYKEKHTEASAYLGVSYGHFMAVIKEMVGEGLITRQKGGYAITDREALEAMTEEVTG